MSQVNHPLPHLLILAVASAGCGQAIPFEGGSFGTCIIDGEPVRLDVDLMNEELAQSPELRSDTGLEIVETCADAQVFLEAIERRTDDGLGPDDTLDLSPPDPDETSPPEEGGVSSKDSADPSPPSTATSFVTPFSGR